MQNAPNPAPVADETSEATIRVLVVEDHAFVQEGTIRLLEREPDIEVAGAAADGIEAVEAVERLRPTLVLMDIAMPRMDGIEATRQIRARMPEIPVLILTAYDDDQYVSALIEAGAAGYLLKDVRSEQLIEAIRSISRGDSVLHPTIASKVIRRLSESGGDSGEGPEEALSARELGVLKLAARGLGNDAIALELGLSARTIQAHLSRIFAKMRVGSRTQAVVSALRQGLISLDELEP